MKILGRPRTWFSIAAAWAALLDVLVLLHVDSANKVATGLLLAIPCVGALAALVTVRRWVAVVGAVAYGLLAVLAILSVGLFLGPGLLAMGIGTLLAGVAPPRE